MKRKRKYRESRKKEKERRKESKRSTRKIGSLARSCDVATDRLVYQDVRGLSTTEP